MHATHLFEQSDFTTTPAKAKAARSPAFRPTPLVGVIDLGSSSLKCMLSQANDPKSLQLVAQIPTPVLQPDRQSDSASDLQSEFDVKALDQALTQALEALAQATAAVGPSQMVAIALTGQIGGAMLLDERGRLQAPCLTWADRRAAAEAQMFAQHFAGRFESLLGHALPPQTCWSAPKIHRLARQAPQRIAKASCVMQLPDYAFYQLTGQRHSVATIGISLVNQRQQRYAPAMLDWAGLREDQLPTLQRPIARQCLSGAFATTWRRITQLPQDAACPAIVLAGADMYCGLFGSHAKPGQAIIQAGTTEIAGVMVPTNHQPPRPDALLRLAMPTACATAATRVDARVDARADAASDASLDVIYGSTSNGGMSLTWLEQTHDVNIHDETLWAKASELYKTQKRDQDTLLFVPHVHGARSPLWRDDATGGFVGAAACGDVPQLLIAVLQGCAMNKLAVLQAAGVASDSHTSTSAPIIVTGGGAKRDLANQIRADILGQPVIAPNISDVTAAGAIALALHSEQPASTWLAQLHAASGSRTYQPDSAKHAASQSLYQRYLTSEAAMLPSPSRSTPTNTNL